MIIEQIKSITNKFPNKIAIYDNTGSITYQDLMLLVSKLAFEFKHLVGQKAVGVTFSDSITAVAARLALTQLGITYVQLLRRISAEEMKRRCLLTGCSVIIADEMYDSLANQNSIIIKHYTEYLQHTNSYTDTHAQPDHELCICWSSGTGGNADALVHSHRSMFHFVTRMGDFPNSDTIGDGVVYTVAPIETTYGLMMLHSALVKGSSIVVESRPFAPSIVANNIVKYKVRNFNASPPIYSILLRRKTLQKHNVPEFCVVGGDICSIRLQQQWQQEYDCHLYNFLGATQNGLTIVRTPDSPWGSLKLFDAECEIELRDQHGNVVPDGQPGEFWTKTKCNAVREITEGIPSLVDGWITTRDVFIKKENYFYIQGRSRDTFKTNGLFVSPVVIEDTIRELPEVDEVVAVHALDDNGLSCVKVCVVPSESIDLLVLQNKIKFHASKLESHERPKIVEIIQALPMHPMTMKVQRGLLDATR
jgi:acyl-coenzyme A synthetase/AMP-(fatty) acid ligase